MNMFCKKVFPIAIVCGLLINATNLFGYEDANIWKCGLPGDFYIVPYDKYFWLYGIFMSGGATQVADLNVNYNDFWQKFGTEPMTYRFYPPIKFSGGTVFSQGNQYGEIMIYGYEGTSNSADEQNNQKQSEGFNSQIEAYPVPFAFHTSIRYNVPKKDKVTLRIYDEAGRLVRTLVNNIMPQGSYAARWDGKDSEGRNVAAGSYFCVVKTNGSSTTKVVHVK